MKWADSNLGPGCSEPFGAGPLEAVGAGFRFLALVTAAVWKLFECATFEPSTQNLAVPHSTATGSIALTPTDNQRGSICTISQPAKYAVMTNVYLLPFLFDPVGGTVPVTTRVDGQWAKQLVTLLLWHHYPTWWSTHHCTLHPSLSTHTWALAHTHQ